MTLRTRSVHLGIAFAIAAGLLLVLLGSPATQAAPGAETQTVVTIQFDDGVADQYGALPILSAHGMRATFYVNSGPIGDAAHMSWAQLRDLAAAGNEIAGHTVTHANVKKLKPDAARAEICGDRNNLIAQGFQPVSFAYPFGSFDGDAKLIVAECGYTSGRGVSGVNGRTVFAETIPPLDALATRTPPNPKQRTSLATIQGYITAAEQNGGGWVQLLFHHLCDQCDAYAITPASFTALLDWLQPRQANGTIVRTTAEVIGGVR